MNIFYLKSLNMTSYQRFEGASQGIVQDATYRTTSLGSLKCSGPIFISSPWCVFWPGLESGCLDPWAWLWPQPTTPASAWPHQQP